MNEQAGASAPSINARLTLPGTIPDLLQRGSPDPRGWTVCSGQTVDDGGSIGVMVADPDDTVYPMWIGDLELDLTDVTGRAHAVWWIARQAEVQSMKDLGFWHFGWGMPPRARSPRRRFRGFTIGRLACWSDTGDGGSWEKVETLAGLDPDDQRTLPDGSRWVDAESLRLVVLHVAGLSG